MTDQRWIHLEGVVNMRDVGGLPTADGRRVQPRRLIRSDNLQDLTATDVATLTGPVGVTDVIDLRTHHEIEASGDGPLRAAGVSHHHYSFYDSAGVSLQEVLAARSAFEAEKVRDAAYWSAHYRGYLTRRPDSASEALRRVAEAPGAAIVHCAAGKDRTGTVVALALAVAGVPNEEIVTDYLLTAERIELIIDRLAGVDFYSAVGERPIAEQTPAREAMEGLLATIDEQGGAREWLRAQGWGEDDLDALAARLLD